jgi:CNT family concentrative nucleoside transporter
LLALVLLKVTFIRELFLGLNQVVLALEKSTIAGTSFVFGYIGGGELPFEEKIPGSSFILAFQAFPIILIMSALSSLLFFWGVLPRVVKAFSWALKKTLNISGSEGLGVSANVFVGMVEAPLLIRPYLKNMTRSELFTLMTCGMATIAGTVMVLYASILSRLIPDVTAHLLIASIISAPAAVVIAKIMIPETEQTTDAALVYSAETKNSMAAVTDGTLQGVQLLINIIAMIIVLVAFVYLINMFLGIFPDIGGAEITLQRLMGYIMSPVVWLMGIPWEESVTAGSLMGIKTVLNELLAYIELSKTGQDVLSQRSALILTYAMCGFANPGSLGIMIGGMGAMAPERKNEIVSLGFRSIIAGTLATCLTGAVIGLLV